MMETRKSHAAARDGSIEVHGEAAIASRPSEGAFDDPAPGQDLAVPAVFGMLDDLDCPFADRGQRRAKLVGSTTPVCGNVAQPDCGAAGLSEPKIPYIITKTTRYPC